MNAWKGKKWYCYGTSLTAPTISKGNIGIRVDGTPYQGRMGYYAEHLAALSGMEEHNFGLGGVGIVPSLYPLDNNKMRTMTLDDGKCEADLITLEVIPNDFLRAPLGELSDRGDDTFLGNLNQIIEFLLKNTRAQVVILIATRQRYSHPDISQKLAPGSEHLKERIRWEKAVEDVCYMHGIPCFNAARGAGIGYYRVENDNGKYYNDQIHIANAGGLAVAKYFFSELQRIYPLD